MIELSIVVPTLNEVENLEPLVERLDQTLTGVSWEVIIVDDDSADGTWQKSRELAQRDPRVRSIRRMGRRGLSSACIEGLASSSAPFRAVMDGDLQHDESILPRMLEEIRTGDYDVVAGSRYIPGGGTGEWTADRERLSRWGGTVVRLTTGLEIQDPMTGFFMLRGDFFEHVAPQLSGIGFKIFLDLILTARPKARVKEVPFVFRQRQAGQSKLTVGIAVDLGVLLLQKTLDNLLPARFLLFVGVGFTGMLLHILILSLLFVSLSVSFALSQATATLVAMTSNYFLNNRLTYRDRPLQGWRLLYGYFMFLLICSVGAMANVVLAGWLFEHGFMWLIAGLIGALFGSVWNYSVATTLIWFKREAKSV